jgi:hypothetical protein
MPQLKIRKPCFCRSSPRRSGNFSDTGVMHAACCIACRRAPSAGPLRFTVNRLTVTGQPAGFTFVHFFYIPRNFKVETQFMFAVAASLWSAAQFDTRFEAIAAVLLKICVSCNVTLYRLGRVYFGHTD